MPKLVLWTRTPVPKQYLTQAETIAILRYIDKDWKKWSSSVRCIREEYFCQQYKSGASQQGVSKWGFSARCIREKHLIKVYYWCYAGTYDCSIPILWLQHYPQVWSNWRTNVTIRTFEWRIKASKESGEHRHTDRQTYKYIQINIQLWVSSALSAFNAPNIKVVSSCEESGLRQHSSPLQSRWFGYTQPLIITRSTGQARHMSMKSRQQFRHKDLVCISNPGNLSTILPSHRNHTNSTPNHKQNVRRRYGPAGRQRVHQGSPVLHGPP